MSSVVIAGDTSGSVTLAAPAVAGTTTLTLPATSGTVLTTASSGQSIPKAALPTGSILQVLQSAKTDVFSTTSTSFVDVTGMSITITPNFTSSKILILIDAQVSNSGLDATMVKVLRNSTDIFIGDAAGSRIRTSSSKSFVASGMESASIIYLDSPATTSAITYKLQMRLGSGTAYLNRSGADTDNSAHPRAASSITVMEIQA